MKTDNLRRIDQQTNGNGKRAYGVPTSSGTGLPYSASQTPQPVTIPVSMETGKLHPGWLPDYAASSGYGENSPSGQQIIAPWVYLVQPLPAGATTITVTANGLAVGDNITLSHASMPNEEATITGGPVPVGALYEYTLSRPNEQHDYPAYAMAYNRGNVADGGWVTIVSGDQSDNLKAPHINLWAYESGAAVRKVRLGLLSGLSAGEKARFPKEDDWNTYSIYADSGYFRGQIMADSGDIVGDLDVGGTLGVWSGLGRAGVVLGNSEGGHGITLQNREGRPVFGAVSPYEDEGGVLSDVAVWIDNKGEKGLYYHLDPATDEYRLEIGVNTLVDGQLQATNILAGTGTYPGAFTGMRFGAEGLQTYGTDYLEQVSIDVQDGRLYFGKREGWLSENGMTIDARLYPADIDDMEHTITWLHNSAYAPSYIGAAIGSQATGEVFMSTRRLMLDGGTPGSWTTNDYSEARLTLRAFDVSSLAGETVELYGRRGAQLRAGDYDYATLAPGGRFSVAFLTAGGTLLHTSDNGQTVSVGTNSATGARLITQADGMPAFRATRSGGQTFDITMEATRTLIGASNTIQIYTGAVDATGQGQIIPAGYMRLGSQASPWQDVYGIRGHFGSLGSQTALAGQFYLTGKQATLMVGLEAENVIAYVRESDLAVGEFYRFEDVDGNHETIRINTAGVLTGDGWYEHEIERAQGADLDNETGLARQWYEGQVGVSLGGNATDGYIRLWGADDQNPNTGPAIVVYQRDNDDLPGSVSERAVFGNLNGFYGYEDNYYGVAFGKSAAQWVALDEANGLRIMDATTQRAVYREYAQIGNPLANNVLITDSTLQLGVGDAYTITMDGSGDMDLTGTLAVATGGAITWAGGKGRADDTGLEHVESAGNYFKVKPTGDYLIDLASSSVTDGALKITATNSNGIALYSLSNGYRGIYVSTSGTGATGIYIDANNAGGAGVQSFCSFANHKSIYGRVSGTSSIAVLGIAAFTDCIGGKFEATGGATTALQIVGGIVDGGSQRYTAMADATADTDGLNRQTADARYAPIGSSSQTWRTWFGA